MPPLTDLDTPSGAWWVMGGADQGQRVGERTSKHASGETNSTVVSVTPAHTMARTYLPICARPTIVNAAGIFPWQLAADTQCCAACSFSKQYPIRSAEEMATVRGSVTAPRSRESSLEKVDEASTRQQEAFAFFDEDGDGQISQSEFALALRSLGYFPTQKEITSTMTRFDSNRDGRIDYSQFEAATKWHSEHQGNVAEELRAACQIFEIEGGSQKIDVARMRHALTTIGECLSPAEVDSILGELNVNADGTINSNDLIQLLFKSSS